MAGLSKVGDVGGFFCDLFEEALLICSARLTGTQYPQFPTWRKLCLSVLLEVMALRARVRENVEDISRVLRV